MVKRKRNAFYGQWLGTKRRIERLKSVEDCVNVAQCKSNIADLVLVHTPSPLAENGMYVMYEYGMQVQDE